MHVQVPTTLEVGTLQHHHVPQIRQTPTGKAARAADDQPADAEAMALYMSLVGALAWLILPLPSICVYVALLQRQTEFPLLWHVRKANRLLRWNRKHRDRLGVWFHPLNGPLRLAASRSQAASAKEI